MPATPRAVFVKNVDPQVPAQPNLPIWPCGAWPGSVHFNVLPLSILQALLFVADKLEYL